MRRWSANLSFRLCHPSIHTSIHVSTSLHLCIYPSIYLFIYIYIYCSFLLSIYSLHMYTQVWRTRDMHLLSCCGCGQSKANARNTKVRIMVSKETWGGEGLIGDVANVSPVRCHDCSFRGVAGDLSKGLLVMDRYNWMHGWHESREKPVAKWLSCQRPPSQVTPWPSHKWPSHQRPWPHHQDPLTNVTPTFTLKYLIYFTLFFFTSPQFDLPSFALL